VCAKNVLLKKERACLFVGIEITMRNASRHTQHTHTDTERRAAERIIFTADEDMGKTPV
jgi:hypothetical protein